MERLKEQILLCMATEMKWTNGNIINLKGTLKGAVSRNCTYEGLQIRQQSVYIVLLGYKETGVIYNLIYQIVAVIPNSLILFYTL